jgi:hypothetical protein
MIRTTLALGVLLAAQVFAADTPLLNLVPAESKVIAGMRVDRTLASPFGRYLLSQARQDDPSLNKFIEATGFDPRRDLQEIVTAASDVDRKKGLVLARGVFMGPQILSAAQAHGAGTLVMYNGVQVLQTSGKRVKWLAIVEGTIAVAGDQEMVKAALDRRAGTTVNSALAPEAASLQNLYDAWVVAAGVFTPPVSARTPAAPAAALAAIQKTRAGVQFGTNVRFTGEAVTRSDKDAQALVDVVRFMASMLQLNRNDNGQSQLIEPILNSMELRAEANTVKMSVSIPEADLEQLLKSHRSTRRASR